MNVEVEIKVKIDNFDTIKKTLLRVGKLSKSVRQIDEYYVPCHRDFFSHKPYPIEWLRIRTNPDGSIFEYDKSLNKKDGSQYYAEEYETKISQPDELRKILKFLDFRKITTIDKHREYWNCGNFEVCLDGVKGLGLFIEVEAKGEFKDVKKAREECIGFLDKLGVKNYKNKQIRTGYPDLLLKRLKN